MRRAAQPRYGKAETATSPPIARKLIDQLKLPVETNSSSKGDHPASHYANSQQPHPARSQSKTGPVASREAWQRALTAKDEQTGQYRTAQRHHYQGHGKKVTDHEIDALCRAVNTGDMSGLNRGTRRKAEAIRQELVRGCAA